MTRWQARRLSKGDRVRLEDGREVTLLIVPWSFPWLWDRVTTDSGWDIHYTRVARRISWKEIVSERDRFHEEPARLAEECHRRAGVAMNAERDRDETRALVGRLLFRFAVGLEGDPWRKLAEWIPEAEETARRNWEHRQQQQATEDR